MEIFTATLNNLLNVWPLFPWNHLCILKKTFVFSLLIDLFNFNLMTLLPFFIFLFDLYLYPY